MKLRSRVKKSAVAIKTPIDADESMEDDSLRADDDDDRDSNHRGDMTDDAIESNGKCHSPTTTHKLSDEIAIARASKVSL